MAPYLLNERRSLQDISSKELYSPRNSILDAKYANRRGWKSMTSKKRAALTARVERLLRDGRFLTSDSRAKKDEVFEEISLEDKSRPNASKTELQDEGRHISFDFRRDTAMLRRGIDLRYLPLNPVLATALDTTIALHSEMPLYPSSSLLSTASVGLATPTPTPDASATLSSKITSTRLLPSPSVLNNQNYDSQYSHNLPTPGIVGLSILGALGAMIGALIAVKLYGSRCARRRSVCKEEDSPIFGGPENLPTQASTVLSWTPFTLSSPFLESGKQPKNVRATLCNMRLAMNCGGRGSVVNAAGQEALPQNDSQKTRKKRSGSFPEKQEQELQYQPIARCGQEVEEVSPYCDTHMHSLAITTPDDALAVSGSERRAPVQSPYYALSSHSVVSIAPSTPSMSPAAKGDIPEAEPTPISKSDSQRERDIRALGAVLGFEYPLPLTSSAERETARPGWDGAIDDLAQHMPIPAHSQETRVGSSGESVFNRFGGSGNVYTQEFEGAGSRSSQGAEQWLSTPATGSIEEGTKYMRARRVMSVPPLRSPTQLEEWRNIQDLRRSMA